MQLNVTFRQMDSSDFLKDYAREKVERVNKYLDRAGEANVVFSLERHLHHADITIHSGRYVLRGHEKSEDMYASIDLAMDKIEKQLRRYKDKLKHHHARESRAAKEDAVQRFEARMDVLDFDEQGEEAVQPTAEPKVVSTSQAQVQTLSLDEAVMQMDLANQDVLVFHSTDTNELNVLYRRREDGKLALIATQLSGGG